MITKKDPWFRNRLIRDGIYRAIYEEMKRRPEIYIMGEGSHMKMHFDARHILEEFPGRVITLPISEDANSNFAVGLSLAGIVPIVDVISSDFLYRTMDAICNTMAKAAAVGKARPMIVRAEFLTGGPTSGQRIEALFAHIPGLRVAIPSNPDDAYGLMLRALEIPAVTIFFEDRMIPDATTPTHLDTREAGACRPAERWSGMIDRARIAYRHPSDDVTVVSYGLTCRLAEEALKGRTATVIDLRTLYPLDVETVLESVKKTRRLLVVEPDVTFLGIGAELVAQIAEKAPGVLVKRLGGPRATIPASRELHDLIIPSAEQICRAVEELR